MNAGNQAQIVANTYRNIVANNLSVNFDRDVITTEEVIRDGGNCVVFSWM